MKKLLVFLSILILASCVKDQESTMDLKDYNPLIGLNQNKIKSTSALSPCPRQTVEDAELAAPVGSIDCDGADDPVSVGELNIIMNCETEHQPDCSISSRAYYYGFCNPAERIINLETGGDLQNFPFVSPAEQDIILQHFFDNADLVRPNCPNSDQPMVLYNMTFEYDPSAGGKGICVCYEFVCCSLAN